MVTILLRYIAQTKPGAKVALVYSDTEFGRDPVDAARATIKSLKLELATEIVTAPGSVDVSAEIVKLRRADPDFTIFHGYVSAPIPEFINQAKSLGLKSQFMGTFWSMDNTTVMKMGPAADGFLGVMPYRYYYDTEGKSPMLERIRKMRPEYQTSGYMQGFLAAMLLTEAAKRTLDNGNELNGRNMKIALSSIRNYDTGGLIGVPLSIKGNSIPIGRIYKADFKAQKMLPVSDWINLQ
jgi:branched-chain amino acid transport system substrate-binding protein